MNNYLLSIDPSIKNTGFTLGKREETGFSSWGEGIDTTHNNEGKPIFITNYNFKKYDIKTALELKGKIRSIIIPNIDTKPDNTYPGLEKFDLIIERGTFHSKNGIGYETQEHLRGFIAGQFNKLLTKDMLISPSEGKKGYLKKYFNELENKKIGNDKEISFSFALRLIAEHNGNITISNHDEADSLLIGGYYLNKENK